LLPEGVLSHCEPYALVVEALYFREEQLGFALFEAGPSQEDVCSALRGYLSSALKSALLFRHSADLYEEALQARAAAEKADRLKTRLLANVSHELRTPLNTIIGFADQALGTPETYGSELSPDLLGDLRHIRDSARHLLRVINDLLDLSRAEIDALDLYPEFIEVRPFLEEAFHSIADTQPSEGPVNWGLELPDRLPIIRADPVRVRQVLLNLLSNARKFTDEGEVVLGAEVTPQHLHLWVSDTGIGIPIDRQELVFEPFVTVGLGERRLEGIGLGLSIARRLVLLHGGSLTLESKPGAGSTFHVYLPLPSLSDCPAPSFSESARAVLLVISARDAPAEELVALARRRELEIRSLQPGDDVDETLAGARPAVLAWDLASAGPGEWAVIQRLRQHPRLSQAPFILYAQEGGSSVSLATGLTDFVSKPVGGETLVEAIGALRPREDAGPILIVDDDPEARDLYRGIVEEALPGYVVLAAGNGSAALDLMAQEPPSLVVLDLMMPEMDGFEVLDRMRAGPRTRQVPVLVLSGRMLTLDDVRRFEEHALVTFQSKGILSAEETAAALHRALFGADSLPAHTSALVKRIVAYLQQNHDSAVSRKEVARTIGVSERYLSQVFRRELGLSPWEYLNRLRVARAKELLDCTDESITGVAARVGFTDPSYFGRVFRRLIGCSPSAYRKEGKQ
jgi:signal transduction histidine kinase/CheY-like chemotaxis protein